jgi:restriction system protein
MTSSVGRSTVGGYPEQLAPERLRKRQQDQAERTGSPDPALPTRPQCGSLMALRTAKSRKNQGSQVWGCSRYPDCKGTPRV